MPAEVQEPPCPWLDTIAITASRLNEAGFWRGGNLTKFSICAATSRLHEVELGSVIDHPIPVGIGVEVGAFERIASQIEDQRHPQLHQRLRPRRHRLRTLFLKTELLVADPDRHDVAVIADVEEGLSRALLHLAGQVGHQVEPVDDAP